MEYLDPHPTDEEIERGRDSLAANEYPGRVIIQGWSEVAGLAIQAYALTGRSEGSRDRIFVEDGDSVRTTSPTKTPEEMAQTDNAELIYYTAMRSRGGAFVVSNGAQTDYVLQSILSCNDLETAVRRAPVVNDVDLSTYEPDTPNNTPRIAGVIDIYDAQTPFGLSIVRRSSETDEPIYSTYVLPPGSDLQEGVGYGIQTYNGNGNPLPSYDQSPFAFPIGEDARSAAEVIWDTLNRQNRVAVVVRSIDIVAQSLIETHTINARS
jgi:IMP cyclohydrolase